MKKLNLKVFADGANINEIKRLVSDPMVKGFTTNPTLMSKAGIKDYKSFAQELIQVVPSLPISLEVFSDDLHEMKRQAAEIASWGKNIYVKIPVLNSKGVSTNEVIKELSKLSIKLNVTAIMTLNQVDSVVANLNPTVPAIVSLFAGRVADTGVDPVPVMKNAVQKLKQYSNFELLWASPREVLNIYQADEIGCHIITVTGDILSKLQLHGKDLEEYSRETSEMFHRDAVASGFKI